MSIDMLHKSNAVQVSYPVVGSCVKGLVSDLLWNGACIKLENGLTGFIYVPDLAWMRKINHPKDVLEVGQKLTMIVLHVNEEKGKIKLGLKQMDDAGWKNVASKYKIGNLVTGKVSGKSDEVAIVELEPGVEGVLNVRQIPGQEIEKLKEGDGIDVHICNVDGEKHRIELTMFKRLKDEEGKDLEEGLQVEFKSSILYSATTHEPSKKQFLEIAREIAAFANAEGGSLYLGVNNQGYVMGVENDLVHFKDNKDIENFPFGYKYSKNEDGYVLRITDIVIYYLGQLTGLLLSHEIKEVGGVKYVKLDVKKSDEIVYVQKKDIYIRILNRMRCLTGLARAEFVKKKSLLKHGDTKQQPTFSPKTTASLKKASPVTDATQETKSPSSNQQTANKSSGDSQTSGVSLQRESPANEVSQAPEGETQSDTEAKLIENAKKSQGEQKDVKESGGKPKSANAQGCGCLSSTGQDSSATELRKDYVDYPVTQVQVSPVRIQILEAFLRCFCSEWSPISLVSRLFRQKTGIDVETFVGYDLDTLSRDPMGCKLLKWRRADKYPHKLEVSAIGGKMNEPSPRTVSSVRRSLKDEKPEDVDYVEVSKSKFPRMRPEMVMVAHILRKVD